MKKNMKSKIAHVILSTYLLAGCTVTDKVSGKPETDPNSSNVSDIMYKNTVIGVATKTALSQEEVENSKSLLGTSNLSNVNVDTKFNASVFRMTNSSDPMGFYVAPKILVQGGKRSSSLMKSGKNTLLPFSITIVDSIKASAQNFSIAESGKAVPKFLQISDYDELKKNIATVSGVNQDFDISSLPGCISKIMISVAGVQYEATSQDSSKINFCEQNKPFPALVTLPEAVANYLLSDGLQKEAIEVSANYEIATQVPISQVKVSFDKEKLYRALRSKLRLQKPPYLKTDVEKLLQDLFLSTSMNNYLQDEYKSQLKTITDQVLKAFFIAADASISDAQAKCKSSICLDLVDLLQSEESKLEISWNVMGQQPIDQSIRLGSKVGPVVDPTTLIGSNKRIGTVGVAEFSNKNLNPSLNPLNVYDSGLIISKGDIVEISPLLYNWERRARAGEEQVGKSEWQECTGKNMWNGCSYSTRINTDYSREYTGDDIWEAFPEPTKKISNVLSGVKIFFAFANNETVSCEVDKMPGFSSGATRSLLIENSPGCVIFKDDRGAITKTGFINDIRVDRIKYTAGTRRESNFQPGSENYSPAEYVPEVRLSMQVKVLGSTFESVKNIER